MVTMVQKLVQMVKMVMPLLPNGTNLFNCIDSWSFTLYFRLGIDIVFLFITIIIKFICVWIDKWFDVPINKVQPVRPVHITSRGLGEQKKLAHYYIAMVGSGSNV